MLQSICAASLLDVVSGHGQLTLPTSRSGSNLNSAGGCPNLGSSTGADYCAYNIDGVTIPGDYTIPDDSPLITMGNDAPSLRRNPWRAPGTTSMEDQYGNYPCGKFQGKDARFFSPTERTVHQSGGTIEVGWAINANHGGGSSVRLCPSNSDLTEECFEQTVLKATSDVSWIQEGSDTSSRREIPALRTTEGTYPSGSEWTRNPIPDRDYYFDGPLGYSGHGPFSWNLIDEYYLPQLPSGDYTLSWRWDCEGSQQVWANCADITIVGGGPTPAPTPVPSVPTPEPTPVPTPSDSCDMGEAFRTECGFYGSTESSCQSNGCCWKPASEGSNTPWCYAPASVAPAPSPAGGCYMAESERRDCGGYGSTETSCEADGCCWKPAGQGSATPWCFQPASMDMVI